MPEKQHLQRNFGKLKPRWHDLVQGMQRLYEVYDLSRNMDEKDRLRQQISAKEAERETMEAELLRLDFELLRMEKAALMAEARRMALNNAFSEAIGKYKEVLTLDPEDGGVAREIERLEERRKTSADTDKLILGIFSRRKEIEPIYTSVLKWLEQRKKTGAEEDGVLDLITQYMSERLSAQEFQKAWKEFESAPEKSSSSADINYSAFAQRLRAGDIVLFLGSDLASELATDAPSTKTVVAGLARQARFNGFVGSLSKIAEYYHISEYGRLNLVANLDDLLSAASPEISFYRRLARLEQPLTIISASYDTLLENAFRAEGKRFALISPFVRNTRDYKVGTLLVEYSDRDQSGEPCQGEDLSGLAPLEAGYSVIFKVRGYCSGSYGGRGPYQDNTLTVAEQNYFTFARYVDKLIPDYLVNEFARKGLVFLGFSPDEWEDRLIASTLLNKRHPGAEPPYVIGQIKDPFKRAYWESLNVRRRQVDLQEFVHKLEAEL